jgi:hypothetical protein
MLASSDASSDAWSAPQNLTFGGGRGELYGEDRGDHEAHPPGVADDRTGEMGRSTQRDEVRVSLPSDPPVLSPRVAALLLRILVDADDAAQVIDQPVGGPS